jgi:hypothetical protein
MQNEYLRVTFWMEQFGNTFNKFSIFLILELEKPKVNDMPKLLSIPVNTSVTAFSQLKAT